MVTIAWPLQDLEGLLFPLPALKPPLSCLQLILLSQLITISLFETTTNINILPYVIINILPHDNVFFLSLFLYYCFILFVDSI